MQLQQTSSNDENLWNIIIHYIDIFITENASSRMTIVHYNELICVQSSEYASDNTKITRVYHHIVIGHLFNKLQPIIGDSCFCILLELFVIIPKCEVFCF